MAIQTSYASTQPIGVPGAQADMRPAKFVSATVETAAIAFGKAVARGSADRTCVLWDNTPPGFLGVAALDRGTHGTADSFPVGSDAKIQQEGAIWVTCASGCTAGDPVYVRPSNGDWQDSNANSAVVYTGAVWDSTASAGTLARLVLSASTG